MARGYSIERDYLLEDLEKMEKEEKLAVDHVVVHYAESKSQTNSQQQQQQQPKRQDYKRQRSESWRDDERQPPRQQSEAWRNAEPGWTVVENRRDTRGTRDSWRKQDNNPRSDNSRSSRSWRVEEKSRLEYVDLRHVAQESRAFNKNRDEREPRNRSFTSNPRVDQRGDTFYQRDNNHGGVDRRERSFVNSRDNDSREMMPRNRQRGFRREDDERLERGAREPRDHQRNLRADRRGDRARSPSGRFFIHPSQQSLYEGPLPEMYGNSRYEAYVSDKRNPSASFKDQGGDSRNAPFRNRQSSNNSNNFFDSKSPPFLRRGETSASGRNNEDFDTGFRVLPRRRDSTSGFDFYHQQAPDRRH